MSKVRLKLQAEELRHQVEETRALAEQAGRQARAAESALHDERAAAKPIITLSPRRSTSGAVGLGLGCFGAPAYGVTIKGPVTPVYRDELPAGEECILTIANSKGYGTEIPIEVNYEDKR